MIAPPTRLAASSRASFASRAALPDAGDASPSDAQAALAARIADLVARASTPEDEALARQREEFDFVTRVQAEADREVNVLRDIETDVRGRDVLLIDDILESGRTLAFAKDLLAARGAKATYTAVLLNKPGHLAAHIAADFEGFTCPDKFVVGYGMDMAHQFRELPFVGHVIPAGAVSA